MSGVITGYRHVHRSAYHQEVMPWVPCAEYIYANINTLIEPGLCVQTGSSNPNYAVDIANGQDASSYYLRRGFSRLNPGVLSDTVVDPGNYYGCFDSNGFIATTGTMPTFDFPTDSDLDDQAVGRLKNKLASNVGQFKAAVPLAELKDVRRSIGGVQRAASGLLQTLIDIRKKKRDALKYASDAWLTWSFGISPVISEVNEGINSIGSYLDRDDYRVRLEARASRDWVSGINGTFGFHAMSTASSHYSIHHSLSYKYIAAFDIRVAAGNNYGVAEHFGLEFKELPSVAWELVPYSWVIDYFTTVGNYLDDTFTGPPGSTIYIVKNRLYRMKGSGSIDVDPLGDDTWQRDASGRLSDKVDFEYFGFERSALSSLPHQQLRFKTTDEIGIHGVNKLLNLAAVFISGR